MKKLSLTAGALLLGISGAASAGTFASGTLGISIGPLPPITLGSNAAAFTVTAGGALTEPASVFGPATIPLPRELFTGVPQISGLTLAGFGNNTKVGTLPGPVLGGLQGSALVNVLGLINLSLPLNVVGGAASGTAFLQGGGITITVHGNPWTTGVQVLTGVTTETPGTALVNTITVTGSQMGVLSGNATVILVTTFKVITSLAGNLPGMAFQTLRFVPEPGTLLLLGSGVVGLLVHGWRKMRR